MAAAASIAPAAARISGSCFSCPNSSRCTVTGAVRRRRNEQAALAWSSTWGLLKSSFPGDQAVLQCADGRSLTRRCPGVASASAAEPKWKQKLAAADEHAEQTRRLTLQAQEEYRKRQEDVRKRQGVASGELTSLKDLEFVPYLTEGLFTDCSSPDAKATVYAIFDEEKSLQYIGVSRQVNPSLRLHFARVPVKCVYLKVQHVTKPNRALLESIKEMWIAENGSVPSGNDGGEQQNVWENPLDCKPLMLESEKQRLQEAAPGPPTAKVLKDVARRIEKDLEAGFKLRNCKERLRFDPKLKDRGLLDIKNTPSKPVSTADPKVAVPNLSPQGSNVA